MPVYLHLQLLYKYCINNNEFKYSITQVINCYADYIKRTKWVKNTQLEHLILHNIQHNFTNVDLVQLLMFGY